MPAETADSARETLGNVIAAADQLGGPTAPALVESARAAFSNGFHVTAASCATILVATAIIMTTLLRSR